MIYDVPKLEESDLSVLKLIQKQRERLRMFTENAPKRWHGYLRKNTFARAIRGSNSIEGYNASIDDAMAAVEEDDPVEDERTETWKAITGYREAMTYILQTSGDPYFELSGQFLKSLHFMMINYDMNKNPGQWRPGAIYVVDSVSGDRVYEAPDAEKVETLVQELIAYLKDETPENPMVKAAMAHLNLTMIHPFRDGNGRMARALQTLVLAQDGIIHPIFSSIEEWLGTNTGDYYDILAEVGQGKWNPSRSALPWIRFCLKAHYQQAGTLIKRHEEYGNLFDKITEIIGQKGLPDRTDIPLFNAALGFRLTNSRYRLEANVSQVVASRELKRLCDEGLLEPIGENRGRTYKGAPQLIELRTATKIQKRIEDPYDMLEKLETERQLSLLDSEES